MNLVSFADLEFFLFSAYVEGANIGRELYVSDGTAAGTRLLKDVKPGPESSYTAGFTRVGAEAPVLFIADDGISGTELWRTDGTPEGTYLFKDLSPGPNGTYITQPTKVPGKQQWIFEATVNGDTQLWTTDGTANNTGRLFPSGGDGSTFRALPFVAFKGVLYYTAYTNSEGYELWVTDGTQAGTHLAFDLRPGQEGSDPRSLTVLRDASGADYRLFFVATGAGEGAGPQLWATNGTLNSTTQVVANGEPAYTFAEPLVGTFASGTPRLLFRAGVSGVEGATRLWSTAGGSDTWLLEQPAFPGQGLATTLDGRGLLNAGSSVNAGGRQLWSCNGAIGGCWLVSDAMGSGVEDSFGFTWNYLWDALHSGGRLWFAPFSVYGFELWLSYGYNTGTYLVKDINLVDQSEVTSPALLGNRLLFTANQLVTGQELWTTDGITPFTEQFLVDLAPGIISGVLSPLSPPGSALTLNSTHLLFAATFTDSTGAGLFITDGTDDGTHLLTYLNSTTGFNSYPTNFRPLGGDVVLFQVPGGRYFTRVWRTDGTPAGTYELLPQLDSFGGGGLVIIPSRRLAVFAQYSPAFGSEPWVTDGTLNGTHLLVDLLPGNTSAEQGGYPSGSSPKFLAASDYLGLAFFSADDGVHGLEVWVTDGTVNGTRMLKDLSTGNATTVLDLVVACEGKTRVYLLITTNQYCCPFNAGTRGLWVTDGTEAGTTKVTDFPDQGYGAEGICLDDGKLLLSLSTPAYGTEPWVSDGTTAGTHLLEDLSPGNSSSYPYELTAAGLWGYFLASRSYSEGNQLWRTNGRHVEPVALPINGTLPPDPMYLTYIAPLHRLYFTALADVHGRQLFAIPDPPCALSRRRPPKIFPLN